MAIEQNKNNETSEEHGGETGGKSGVRPIKVYSHAGYKRGERPRAFELDGRRLTVLSVKKTWQEESGSGGRHKTVFRVHAHDGRNYDLSFDGATSEWSLEPFDRGRV